MCYPERTCKNSVTTKSGTFTFFAESVTLCQAEKKCKRRGEILSPIASRKDAKRIMRWFDSNSGVQDCPFQESYAPTFWTGLDVFFTETGEQKKVFYNGAAWSERRHGKVWHDMMKEPSECAVALFDPFFNDNPFLITADSEACVGTSRNFYTCFKPAGNATKAEPIKVRDGFDDDAFVFPSGSIAAVIFAAGAFAGVMAGVGLLKRKHAKERAEFDEWRRVRKSGMENSSVCDIAAGENQ